MSDVYILTKINNFYEISELLCDMRYIKQIIFYMDI